MGPDGSIAVLDLYDRFQIFDGEGRFVRSIGSKGDGPGQFRDLHGVAHGAGGEIIVSDFTRNDVQVFSGEGELLQIIGAEGDSKVAWQGRPRNVAADAKGRIALLTIRQDCNVDGEGNDLEQVILLSNSALSS